MFTGVKMNAVESDGSGDVLSPSVGATDKTFWSDCLMHGFCHHEPRGELTPWFDARLVKEEPGKCKSLLSCLVNNACSLGMSLYVASLFVGAHI